METQQELGAQALLQLGSKAEKKEMIQADDGDADADDGSTEYDIQQLEDVNSSLIQNGDVDDDDEESKNQQLNDAVEAAVMRYVGGTLDRKKRRQQGDDDLMSEFSPWTGFLEDDIADHQQSNVDFAAYSRPHSVPQTHKKRRKKHSSADGTAGSNDNDANSNENSNSSNNGGNNISNNNNTNNVDPDLSGLDASEHDQLVQAAILDARELAKHLGNGGSLQEHDVLEAHNSLHNQQVIAAANAAVNHNHASIDNADNGKRSKKKLQKDILIQFPHPQHHIPLQQQHLHHQHPHHAQHAQHELQHTLRGKQLLPPLAGGQHQHQLLQDVRKFDHLTSIETVVEEASNMACSWYNTLAQPFGNGPVSFSDVEIGAVEHFISGYGHLHKLTRQDVCNRIWSAGRKKDNFWESLTRILPYRSRASVYKHVRRQFHVFDVRGKWTREDDETLRKIGSTKEGNWKEIGEIMGRMPEDCRDRWRNYIKCGDNRVLNKWSVEEEDKLREIVNELLTAVEGDDKKKKPTQSHGPGANPAINWTIVSEKMNGVRSRIQCRYKWNKMIKKSASLRTSFVDINTKLWLVRKIQSLGFLTRDVIDWDYIVHMYNSKNSEEGAGDGDSGKNWTSEDFKAIFDTLEKEIPHHKKRRLVEVVDELDIIYTKSVENEHNNHSQKQQHQSVQQQSHVHAHPQKQPQHKLEQQQQLLQASLGHLAGANSNGADEENTYAGEAGQDHDVDEATSIANAAVAAVTTVNSDDVQQQEYNLWR